MIGVVKPRFLGMATCFIESLPWFRGTGSFRVNSPRRDLCTSMRCSGAGALAVRRAIRRPAAAVRGGRGRRARAPPSHAARGAVARAVAARSVRAATYRRDFAKGLHVAKGQAWTFRRDFRRGTFEEAGTFEARRDSSQGLIQRDNKETHDAQRQSRGLSCGV